LKKKRGPILFT